MEAGFSGKLEVQEKDHEAEVKALHTKIGQLTVERDFLEDASSRRRQARVEPSNNNLSITMQCRFLSISRSGWVLYAFRFYTFRWRVIDFIFSTC